MSSFPNNLFGSSITSSGMLSIGHGGVIHSNKNQWLANQGSLVSGIWFSCEKSTSENRTSYERNGWLRHIISKFIIIIIMLGPHSRQRQRWLILWVTNRNYLSRLTCQSRHVMCVCACICMFLFGWWLVRYDYTMCQSEQTTNYKLQTHKSSRFCSVCYVVNVVCRMLWGKS